MITADRTQVPKCQERVALVTVLYNCSKHLPLFFGCMGRQVDRDFLVVVIDNASRDNSLADARALAEAHRVPCEFIANEENLGIAEGNNQGIELSRRLGIKHIVLINNDIACDDDLIARIRTRAIAAGHRAWTCLAYYGDTDEPWYCGGRLSYWRARGIHLSKSRGMKILDPCPVTYAPTCLMYLHASVFDEIGMMDPRYFVYYDDTDFCRRLADAGIKLIYDPSVEFRHYVGGSSGGDLSDYFVRASTRNKFIYIRKHYRGISALPVLALNLLLKLLQLSLPRRRRQTINGLLDAYRAKVFCPWIAIRRTP